MNAHPHLSQRLELAFWDFTIQTLSDNIQVRRFIRKAYRTFHKISIPAFIRRLAASAVIGLTAGVLLFILTLYSG